MYRAKRFCLRNNPLAIVCLFFCLGIWAARYVHIPVFFIYASCVLFLTTALVSLKRQLLFSLSLGIAIFLVGFLHLQNAQTYPANHILNFISDNPQKAFVRGRVVSNPEASRTFYHSKKTTFTFRAYDLKTEKNWKDVRGLIKVMLYGEREIQYGDELLLQGLFSRPPGLRNPGGFNYRAYLANHNIFGTLKVKEKDAFKILTPSPLPSPRWGEGRLRTIFKFKQRLHRIIFKNLAPPQAALLSAILLGERANLSQDTKDLFISTGTIHILAISGLHVGLIALILIALFKFLRLPRRLNFIFTVLLLICYAALSGARPSVLRATTMAVVVLLGLLINREPRIYNSLGLVALLVLIARPQYLFDSGFQLSFLSVISIVYFAPRLERLFSARPAQKKTGGSARPAEKKPGGLLRSRCLLYLARAFSVSLAAWIGIVPLTAYYFNIVTPVAVAANLLVIPYLFFVVSAGICFLVFAYLWAPLGAIFAQTSWLSLVGLSKLVSVISRIPLGCFHLPSPGIFFFCGYYALILLIFNHRRLRLSSGQLGIIILLAANALVWKPLFKALSNELTVTFLDVGLGDAIFIQFPYSEGTMLIDGGPATNGDAGRWVILPFLWDKGINKIDALVLTHPDNDHVGGLASVLKNVKVNYVFDNGMAKDSISYNNYKRQVAARAHHYCAVKRGEEIAGFPQVKLLVINPPEPLLAGTGADTNNNSVVLKLAYADVSFLFSGDIQKEVMPQLLAYSSMLKSTVLKVPHHGSDEEKTEDDLFQAILPETAVITASRTNRFGFPAPELMERLDKLGIRVYKTGKSGAVIVSTDGRNTRVEAMLGPLR